MQYGTYNKLLEELQMLPTGGLTYKKINGKSYLYYQWRENGKQRSRRVKEDEEEILAAQIARRKALEQQKRELEAEYEQVGGGMVYEAPAIYQPESYRCSVRLGETLNRFVQPVKNWKKREQYKSLHNYIYGTVSDRVYILYGLRRTGKTTLIRQIISDMEDEMREKTVFMQMQGTKTLADVNHDLKLLEQRGYQFVFLDEITLLDDFIEGAALFSDVFAASGMKIVLSGTDSLGFVFAQDEELYDRCITSHTTFIPYREFARVLGINGIDNYIRYGGTMSLSGQHYNTTESIFSSEKRTDEYVDSAIARNIQHSLKNYQSDGHFRSLRELYEKNELTNVINRVVEDINHRFTLEVLTREFESSDLRISARNLRKDRKQPMDVLDQVDVKTINQKLKELLEIRNRSEQTVDLQESHRQEIKEYLDLLDLTVEIEIRWMTDYNRRELRTVFSQPGIRYAQADALIQSLMQDEAFRSLSLDERRRVTARIQDEIKGRMMEDIVLLETKLSKRQCEVFKLQYAVGEFDMVVFYPEEACCEIYEVKHSKEVVQQQCRHLLDHKKCEETAFRYGAIRGKYVIYRGEDTSLKNVFPEAEEDITYMNVEKYLKTL